MAFYRNFLAILLFLIFVNFPNKGFSDNHNLKEVIELEEDARVIPSDVKAQVWKRDKGQCVKCGSKEHLHFDHILPYSKGGTSRDVKNIQLLCAKHNLQKSDKII